MFASWCLSILDPVLVQGVGLDDILSSHAGFFLGNKKRLSADIQKFIPIAKKEGQPLSSMNRTSSKTHNSFLWLMSPLLVQSMSIPQNFLF